MLVFVTSCLLADATPMPAVVSDQGFPQKRPALAPLLFHLWFL